MVKVLLDTNIIIYRETNRILKENTPDLFKWLDRLHYDKYIHPLSIEEISKYGDEETKKTILTKLKAYNTLSSLAPLDENIKAILSKDADVNSKNDTKILNELYCGRVDFLITQDKGIYNKAKVLGISDKVFSVESFSAQMLRENPDLIDYSVLSVKKRKIGTLDYHSHFFDSLRESYAGFNDWLNRKSEEYAYVCFLKDELKAFLYLKTEDEKEVYFDIIPNFLPKKRLKIGTFKVSMNGLKLGERFLKIAFENAINKRVDEIYVTIFDNDSTDIAKQSLVVLLQSFGFYKWGTKSTGEGVYVKDMRRHFNNKNPRASFPYISKNMNSFIVPIWPKYHTELLPDSILNNERTEEYQDNKPHMNSITKVYISRSINRDLNRGDNIIFYRTKTPNSNALYSSVITTIGIVMNVYDNIKSLEEFKEICRKKSVMSEHELEEFWYYPSKLKPFVVEFLYAYPLPTPKINLYRLIKEGIISNIDNVPRGFELLSKDKFNKILEISRADESYIVN